MARIVPHDQLPAAAPLNALRWQAGAIGRAALAGLVVACAGNVTAYTTTVVGFAASVLVCRRPSSAPPAEHADRPSLRGIAEGARYAWSRPVLLGTYAVDLGAISSPSRTPSSPSWPTSWTRTGRWG